MFIADADIFQEKKMLKKRLLVKTARYDWSLYYIRKAIKRRWEVVEVKLRVSLKTNATNSFSNSTRVNMCMGVERNQDNQK